MGHLGPHGVGDSRAGSGGGETGPAVTFRHLRHRHRSGMARVAPPAREGRQRDVPERGDAGAGAAPGLAGTGPFLASVVADATRPATPQPLVTAREVAWDRGDKAGGTTGMGRVGTGEVGHRGPWGQDTWAPRGQGTWDHGDGTQGTMATRYMGPWDKIGGTTGTGQVGPWRTWDMRDHGDRARGPQGWDIQAPRGQGTWDRREGSCGHHRGGTWDCGDKRHRTMGTDRWGQDT